MLHTIKLSQIRTDLRKAIAFLRRCKKPRRRKALEQKLRESVTGGIENEAEIYALRDQLKFLIEFYLDQSEIHAAVECRYLCEQMRHKLPREIRDTIYGHIIGHQSVQVLPRSATPDLHVELPQHPDFIAIFESEEEHPVYWLENGALSMCHAFESDFVGNETCRELVEILYERASFVFADPAVIPSFLVRDPWFFKVSPKKHVRKVTLRIPEALIRATTMQLLSQRENRRNWIHVYIGPSRNVLSVETMLAELGSFRTSTRIILHIVPGIDIDRNLQVRIRRAVEPWDKVQGSIETLLEGLAYLSLVLARVKLDDRQVDVCLDSQGECIITEENSVWSPLGWLEQTMTWGLEERE
jgi:hypothetical protein